MNNKRIEHIMKYRLSTKERFSYFLQGMLVGSILGTGILTICLIIFKLGLCGIR